jgi:hypothetical protein
MDGQLTAAITSAGISAAAAGVAIWQALIARHQAATATEAAELAERQAVAAEQQVKAVEDQVALARRQLDAEDAEREDTRGPQFDIESGYTDESDVNVPRGVLVLRQKSGPALSNITVNASGEGVEGLQGPDDPDSSWGYQRVQSIDIGSLAAGGTKTVRVDLDYDTRETTVVLHLECGERDGTGTWRRSAAKAIEPPPAPPQPWVARGRGR